MFFVLFTVDQIESNRIQQTKQIQKKMPFNVMIQLCRVTRASKLFQRNFYLPLLKPLSPKDALRRHIISGKNLLGKRIEHYIPVLEEYAARVQRRKYVVKGLGKKRQRKKSDWKYLTPLLDMDMEYHPDLHRILNRKSKGRGQYYTYYVPDKNMTIVINHQMERAIRDHDILDVTVAQRSDKILVKLNNGLKLVMPLLTYDGNAPFYRGEGWTRKEIEEYHHHGKETMGLAKLFEAKESGVEEWELEMMRLANKRKKKQKGEGTADWKTMMSACVDNMDWDKFESDTKQIVEEVDEPIDDEPIPMEIDDMEKTKNVIEKLLKAGPEALNKLPLMPEIPELIKIMKDGELTELAEVSGVNVKLPSTGVTRFVAGQIVNGDEGEIFVPGQTVEKDDGLQEYTPGFTVLMDGEPTLLPGLVMGDDPNKPMFLPGESTITETGELQFTETEDDVKERSPSPQPEPEIEEVELDEDQNSEEEEEEAKPPPPPPKKKEYIYERPKRLFQPQEDKAPKRRERKSKKPMINLKDPAAEPSDTEKRKEIQAVIYDMSLPSFEKDTILQEKERVENFTEKKAKEEYTIEKKRREIRLKAKEIISKNPEPIKYEPVEMPRKSAKLQELEMSIKKGEFFSVDHKKYLNKGLKYQSKTNWLNDTFAYKNTLDSVGISRHKVWKSVY